MPQKKVKDNIATPVSVTACPDYDIGTVGPAVERLFSSHEGFTRFVKPGERVLLKVNLLAPTRPDRHTTTHPAVVAALARLVRDAGATAVIGDSMGAPFRPSLMRTAYWRSGLSEVARETGAELNQDFATMRLSNPGGSLVRAFDLCRMIEGVDKIIAVPKVKTHQLVTLTCASKILFGLVPGMLKTSYHQKLPDVDQFGQMLVDLTEFTRGHRPTLFLTDGVVGMEGEGPSHGTPRPLGALLLSEDPYRLDSEVCRLIGLDPRAVPMLRTARRSGLSAGGPAEALIVGEAPVECDPPFTLPRGSDMQTRMPRVVSHFFRNQLQARPTRSERCVLCETCIESCPVRAIRREGESLVFDYGKCIRCYCCDELCPHGGIELERTRLGRMLARGI